MKKIILVFLTLLVSFISLITLYFSLIPAPKSTLDLPLNELITKEIPGWIVKDLDLASSEEGSDRVASFLNLDDSLFRIYSYGLTHVSLYIAYWTPGKVSYRWAGAHTPDTCWVANGWKRLDRKYAIPFKCGSYQLKNAEFGTYVKGKKEENVYFWHLIGGKPYTYEQKEIPNIFGSIIDIQRFGLDLRQEQFFIRLSSNKKIDYLNKLKGFNEIIGSLLEINLSLNDQ